jgi:hypothetical protein
MKSISYSNSAKGNKARANEKKASAKIRGMRENTGSNTVFSTGKSGGLRTERYPSKIVGTATTKTAPKKTVSPAKPSAKMAKKIK